MSLQQSSSQNTLISFREVALTHGRGYHVPPRADPWSPFSSIKNAVKEILLFSINKKDKKAHLEKNTATPTDDKALAIQQLPPSSASLMRIEASIEFQEDESAGMELTKSNLDLFIQTMDKGESD